MEDRAVAKCQLTDKNFMVGHIVSHSNKKANTVRHANVKSRRIFNPETGTFVRMNVSTRALRTLARKGLSAFKT